MAGLRDSNGRIVIDEAEAESEARKIEQAKAKLDEARVYLDSSKLDSERMRGETRDALDEVYSRLTADFKKWEESCGMTAKYIRDIVKQYQKIDREYAAKVRGFSGSGRGGKI